MQWLDGPDKRSICSCTPQPAYLMTFATTFATLAEQLRKDFHVEIRRDGGALSAVAEEDELTLVLHSGDAVTMSARALHALATSAIAGNVGEHGVFRNGGLTIARCIGGNPAAQRFCQTVSLSGRQDACLRYVGLDHRVWMQKGITELSLMYSRDQIANEFYPEFDSDWMFVCVSATQHCDALPILQSYFFALEDALGWVFQLQPFPQQQPPPGSSFDDRTALLTQELRLRPLLAPEHSEIVATYMEACAIASPRFRTLALLQLIETIAARAFRDRAHRLLRGHLMQRAALCASPPFIANLMEITTSLHHAYRDHREVLRIGLETFCQPVTIAALAPPCLADLAALTVGAAPHQRDQVLARLSTVLAATGAELASPPTSHVRNGHECPHQQLSALAELTTAIARQAIHWLADEAEAAS